MSNTIGYHVPTMVAVTTALAAGGGLFLGVGVAPPGAQGVDFPVSRIPQTVAGGGQLLITWPALGATEFGLVTAIGVSTTDIANTRITTRVNGVTVAPFNQVIGAVGTLDDPTELSAPIELRPGDVFSILMENISGVNVDMIARTQGWIAS